MQGSVYSYRTARGARRWGYVYDLPADPMTGKRRQQRKQGFESQRDASKALRDLMVQADGGVVIPRDSVTVAQFLLDEWLPSKAPGQPGSGRRSRGRLGVSSWQSYTDYIRAYLVPTIGAVKLQDLTPAHLERAYSELERSGGRAGRGLSAKTLANLHGILHKALADAVRWDRVVRNVADVVDGPRADRPRTEVWTVEELRAFIRHVEDDEYYALWLLYATTGLRRGEALGLCWPDLDLVNGLATVNQTLGSLHGKAVWKPRPKSEASARTLALDPSTVRALKEHRKRQLEWQLLAGPGWQAEPEDVRGFARAEAVFTWPDGGLINPERVSKWFERHVRAAGLPKVRLHDVRHSYATAALRQATGWHEVKTLSRRLGHASVGMTLDTYAHALPADDRLQADTLARVLLGPE
ncbi:tyrosine-type recombinase/integrase [Euzebya sp.]|uniref:site-specific integrase n=1 Tax=Euzebya sp. TaxID=1971409 RepID=UPI003519104A